MGLKSMVEKTDLKKILKPIMPSKYTFTSNLGFDISPFSKNYQLLVPNELTNKGDSKLVGIAFDYMARFIIANTIEHNKKLVLKDMVCGKVFDTLADVLNGEELSYYRILYDKAIVEVENYVMNINSNYLNILPHVFLFARLEQIQRIPSILLDAKSILKHEYLNDVELQKDLKRNCEVFEQAFIKSGIVKKDSVVVFNPHFGIWSIKCFGADADVFIDGVLYDFKCTDVYGYRSRDIAQICGYYVLHRLSQITDNKEYEKIAPLKNMDFKAIALYKSRYGAIERYDISKFDKEKLDDVINQAMIFINEYYNNTILFESFMESKNKMD